MRIMSDMIARLPLVVALLLNVCLGWLCVGGTPCYPGQDPHPHRPGEYRWVLQLSPEDRCSCTSLKPGGYMTLLRPDGEEPFYFEEPLFTDNHNNILRLFECPEEFSIINKPAEMSSTYRSRTAALSVDGIVDTTNNGDCSHSGGPASKAEYDPWWRVDLQGNHCIKKVTILNRGYCCSTRTTHAVVRAGPNTNVTTNPTCGDPVTAEQAAIPGGEIEMTCDPPLRARYVSVNIPVVTILNFCEVFVKELPMTACN